MAILIEQTNEKTNKLKGDNAHQNIARELCSLISHYVPISVTLCNTPMKCHECRAASINVSTTGRQDEGGVV